MAGVSFSVEGDKLIQRKLEEFMENAEKAMAAAVYTRMNEVRADAVERTPMDIGTLKNSIYVTLPVKVGGNIVCEIGAGGPAEAYALSQHEETTWRHPNGGEAKFLENAINAASGTFLDDIALEAKPMISGSNAPARPAKQGPTSPDEGAGARSRRSKGGGGWSLGRRVKVRVLSLIRRALKGDL